MEPASRVVGEIVRAGRQQTGRIQRRGAHRLGDLPRGVEEVLKIQDRAVLNARDPPGRIQREDGVHSVRAPHPAHLPVVVVNKGDPAAGYAVRHIGQQPIGRIVLVSHNQIAVVVAHSGQPPSGRIRSGEIQSLLDRVRNAPFGVALKNNPVRR